MRLVFVAVSALLLASPALAETPPASAAKKEAKKDDPNRIVCTREHVVGSNRPQKVCMTVAERERLKDQSQRFTDEGRRTGGSDSQGSAPSM